MLKEKEPPFVRGLAFSNVIGGNQASKSRIAIRFIIRSPLIGAGASMLVFAGTNIPVTFA